MKTGLRILTAVALVSGAAMPVAAKLDSVPEIKVKNFSITPTGRMLMDAAVYTPDGDGLNAGAAIPDIRLGAKMKFGNWAAKIDVGFGYASLSIKDVYLQYNFNPGNYLRAGYFVHQFGLNAATSSSMKPAMEAPTSDDFFAATSRNIGIEYVHDSPAFFAGVSAIVDNRSLKMPANEQGKVSYGGITRLVWRPLHKTGLIAQIGLSGWVQSADHNMIKLENGEKVVSPGFIEYKANFPTRVCKTQMLGANVTDARHLIKLSPEWLFAYGRIATEGQFYYSRVSRHNGLHAFTGTGVYNLLRGILIGKDYSYSHGDAGLATPASKSLELVLGYNYTDGTDRHAGVFGGITNDVSANLNYYFNKYIIARLGWRYTNVKNSVVQPNRHTNMIQARIQFIF